MTTVESSARGRASRNRGNATETMVARWLRGHGHPDALTARAALGHSGTRQPGDIVGVAGLAIEVKGARRPEWAAWLRQTELQAATAGLVGVLVWRRPGIADVGRWLALVPHLAGPWWATGGTYTVERTGSTCNYHQALMHAEHEADRHGASTPVLRHTNDRAVVVGMRLADLLDPARYGYLTTGVLR